MLRHFTNIAGFDDAPFPIDHVGQVKVVGTVYSGPLLNGVLIGEVEKDGQDATETLVTLVAQSKFAPIIQLLMLQGITMGGFNVVDAFHVHEQLARPILIVSRKLPDMAAIKEALLMKVRGGGEKWALIEKLGPMESVEHVYVQRVGLTLEEATEVVKQSAIEGWLPEPLRVAHLIAGALVEGQSRGRA